MCCDWQGTIGTFVKSDDVDKFRWYEGASVLIAGELTAADELVTECKNTIIDFSHRDNTDTFDLDINNYLSSLRTAAAKRKRDIVKNHIEMSLSLTVDDFWKNGRSYLSAELHSQEINEIKEIDLKSSIMICSIASSVQRNDEAVIIKVDRGGLVSWENNYSTIGTGSIIAHAFLCQYNWSEEIDLMTCLYRIFCAKRAAEKNPGVGPTTSFEILHRRKRFDLSDEGYAYLKRKVDGRKEPRLQFKTEYLAPEEDEER
jgi:hypothetical protein